jgi:hypothetical protein
MEVQDQPGQIVCKTSIFKITRVDWRCGSRDRTPDLQEQNPEFKPQLREREREREREHLLLPAPALSISQNNRDRN